MYFINYFIYLFYRFIERYRLNRFPENWGFARPNSAGWPIIKWVCIYLQGEMSGSFAVFVWHIRQTLEPTEIRLRVSRCCCPRPPGDTCCVSQPFKLQAEPSGAVADGCCCIGMPHSCSKLTVESAREKDTYGTWCICMIHHVPALIYTPFAIAAPGFKRLFSVADRSEIW